MLCLMHVYKYMFWEVVFCDTIVKNVALLPEIHKKGQYFC